MLSPGEVGIVHLLSALTALWSRKDTRPLQEGNSEHQETSILV